MRVLGIYFSFLSSSDIDMKNQVTLNWHNDRAFDFGNAFFFNMKKKNGCQFDNGGNDHTPENATKLREICKIDAIHICFFNEYD